jgi:hypothetical protein
LGRLGAEVQVDRAVGVGLESGALGGLAQSLGVADGELDHGVAAVVSIQLNRTAGPVGDERLVVPASKQLPLVGAVAHTTHDQPVAAQPSLGDLRDAEGAV